MLIKATNECRALTADSPACLIHMLHRSVSLEPLLQLIIVTLRQGTRSLDNTTDRAYADGEVTEAL